NVETEKVLLGRPRPPGTGMVNCIEWHPAGRLVAVANPDFSIELWDVEAGQLVLQLKGHKSKGVDFCFSRAGDRLVSNDWSGILRVWDVSTGRLLLSHPVPWNPLQFNRDDTLLAASLATPKIQLFRCRTGRDMRTMMQPAPPGGRQSGYRYG